MSLVSHAGSPIHTFAGPFGEVRLRVHAPAQHGSGALIFFNEPAAGAAGVDGRVDGHVGTEQRCVALANAAACSVLAVDSALIAEPRFPRAVDEAYFITCFLHEHADELGLDHRRIALGGQGFGATLATAAARLAKERRNPDLAFQLLLFPVLDLGSGAAPGRAQLAASYLRHADDAVDPRASPLLAKNLIGLPATHLVATPEPAQQHEAESYLAALEKAFVPATLALAEDFASALAESARRLRSVLEARG